MARRDPIKTLRNKCDKLLTPIIIKQHPKCLLCNNPTQVAHHHVHKSQSSALRYNLDNLIPLCHSCHLALHCNESYHASRIIEIKGIEWFKKLDKEKREIVKTNKAWYEENLARLKDILDCG